MKIVHENFQSEKFIDVLLTEHELEEIKEYKILSVPCQISGQEFFLGLKLGFDHEFIDEEVY